MIFTFINSIYLLEVCSAVPQVGVTNNQTLCITQILIFEVRSGYSDDFVTENQMIQPDMESKYASAVSYNTESNDERMEIDSLRLEFQTKNRRRYK